MVLFAAGLLITGVLGAGGYAMFKPKSGKPDNGAPPSNPVAVATQPSVASAPSPAPAPPGPAPAPSSPPADFSVTAEFQRLAKAQTAGHSVELTLVRTTVRSEKDSIAFTVKSSQEGYLYVYNRGSDGSLLQIYPNKKSGSPKVRKDVPIDLPRQTDDELRISGPSGTSELLVMVSKLQRDHSALPARVEHGYSFYPTGQAAAALAAKNDGPLPWFAGKPKCPTGAATCADEFGAAVVTFNIVQ